MSERKAIPMVGFGTWTLRGDVARRAVSEALEVGYRHVDTAQMYENEGDVGAALAASGIAPADLYVVTKLWPDRFERRIAREETGRSLDRLRLDRVDLLLAHWPSPNVSVEDIVDQLAAVQGEGLCAAFGVSNFNNGMLARAVAQAPGRVATNQVEFNPLLDQRRLLGTARRLGVPLTAYCPLARGGAMRAPAVASVAARTGRPASQVALRWAVQQGVIVVPMSTRRANMISNLEALSFVLSDADVEEISAGAREDGRMVENPHLQDDWQG